MATWSAGPWVKRVGTSDADALCTGEAEVVAVCGASSVGPADHLHSVQSAQVEDEVRPHPSDTRLVPVAWSG
jgi:hypothetical protein